MAGNTYVAGGHSLAFATFGQFTGGDGVDTININAQTMRSTVNGGGGNDEININAEAFLVVGGDGDDAFTLGPDGKFGTMAAASVLSVLIGGAGNDALIAADTGGRFTLTGMNEGQLTDRLGNPVVGPLTDPNIPGFTGIENLTGGAGADTFTFEDAGSLTGNLDGGMGTDTLQGDDDGNTFTLTGNGEGTLMDKIGGAFTGIENLSGGNMMDTFTITADHSGDLDGGGGMDTFTINATLMGNVVGGDGADTFNIAETLMGNVAGGDGNDRININMGGAVTGDVLGGGGDDADTFTLADTASITGDIIGGAGADHLIYSASTEEIIITVTGNDADGFSGLATGITGGFFDIDRLTADANNVNQLRGDNTTATWTLDANNTYAVMRAGQADTLTFSGFDDLIGGSGVDTFNINVANINLFAAGGAGNDVFNINAEVRSAEGEAGDDAFIINAQMDSISGGEGDDTFTFEDAGEITGNLEGGMGDDTLQGDNDGNTFTLTGNNSGQLADGAGNTLIGGGFTGIENLIGGDLTDAFTIATAFNGNLDGGGGDDAININMGGSVMGDIDTGAGNDEITLEGNASITGDINLGEGDDTLTFASADVRFMGLADGGAGMDTLDGLNIFTDPSATTIFRYTNFEVVNGEDALLANLPVIRMEEIETTGAMRTLIAYVDDPSQGMPDPDAMGGADGTDGADGDADMMGGGQPDSSAGAGGTDTDTDTATPTPPPPADNVQIAAELSRTYGGEITPLNAAGDAPAEVNAYLFVDPTGPAAQEASVGALSTTVNTVVNQRLSGSVPGGGGGRRTARPVQVAAGALLPVQVSIHAPARGATGGC